MHTYACIHICACTHIHIYDIGLIGGGGGRTLLEYVIIDPLFYMVTENNNQEKIPPLVWDVAQW